MSDYLDECKEKASTKKKENTGFRILKELLEFETIDAFAITIIVQTYPISKKEISECLQLEKTINKLCEKYKMASRGLRVASYLLLFAAAASALESGGTYLFELSSTGHSLSTFWIIAAAVLAALSIICRHLSRAKLSEPDQARAPQIPKRLARKPSKGKSKIQYLLKQKTTINRCLIS